MVDLSHYIRNPRRFMQVDAPLPHQVGNRPIHKKRTWPCTVLAIVVVTCGIVYLLYLDGHIGNNNNTDSSSPNDASTVGTNNTTTKETNAPSTTTTSSPPPSTTTTTEPSDTMSSTTTSPPTLSPIPQSQLVYTGWCSDETPCFECEGQCWLDSDCHDGLACFSRFGIEEIPNCAGVGVFGVNYCYSPDTIPILEYVGECSPEEPCGLCQGDCDDSSDCQEGLVCEVRHEYEPVFNCAGVGIKGKDYCVSYEPVSPPTLEQTTVPPTVSPPTRAPSSIVWQVPTIPKVLYVGECSPEDPCGLCEGDCDRESDCEEGLVCQERWALEPVAGCSGIGEEGMDYCIKAQPTTEPTTKPTTPPTTQVPTDPMLTYVRECSSDEPCGLCEGDCDKESDCEEGLVCQERWALEPVAGCSGIVEEGKDYCVKPQPTAEPTTRPTIQMPTDPMLAYVGECSSDEPCGLCEGDCDKSSDCKDGLVCQERYEYEPIEGCSGLGQKGKDYCVKPQPTMEPSTTPTIRQTPAPTPWPTSQPTQSPTLRPTQAPTKSPTQTPTPQPTQSPTKSPTQTPTPRPTPSPTTPRPTTAPPVPPVQPPTQPRDPVLDAVNDCTISNPCDKCQGDCIQDADCLGNLVCFRRTFGEPVPGCVSGGSGDLAQANYCHEPLEGGPLSYVPGDLTVNENGLVLSTGLTSRIIATYGKPVVYDTGGESSIPFHIDPDAAATFETPDGGWIYVSNSENEPGGVGAIRFTSQGLVTNYEMIATETTFNCGGGKTWWNTWLTCEEKAGGSVWETDPYGIKPERRITLMGTGRFESAAYYRPITSLPTFYITEDVERGALRRFTPDRLAVEIANQRNDYSQLLHSNPTGTAKLEFLKLFADTDTSGTFEWTTDENAARNDAKTYYSFSEGLDIARGILYVTAKKARRLLALDLERGTWSSSSTESGAFNRNPDQIRSVLGEDRENDLLYFCEDGGEIVGNGVHGRDSSGNFYNVLNGQYKSESTGLAFSPDLRFLYVSYQDNPGTIFEVKRRDGYPFAGTWLDIKYSAMKS